MALHVITDVFRVCKDFEPDSFERLFRKAIVEIKTVGFSKGMAVREMMAHSPFAGRIPIFIGDNIRDESAFAVMLEFNGLAMSVGRKLSDNIDAFKNPRDVRLWLERISNNMRLRP